MNSGRKRFNKKVIALVLALSMLFSQNALVFATEGAEPVSQNETVDAPVQAPADGEVTTPEENAPVEEPEETAEPVEAPDPAKEVFETVSENEDEAGTETVEKVEETGTEAEENAGDTPSKNSASENTSSGNVVSFRDGTIKVSINSTGSANEVLSFNKGVASLSALSLKKVKAEEIGFDFTVLSGNKVLTEGTDYSVDWLYEADSYIYPAQKTSIPTEKGTIIVSINGMTDVSGNGYKDWINVTASVNSAISENDVAVTPSSNRVTVKNNSQKTIYVDLWASSTVSNDFGVIGEEVASGAEKIFYTYFNADNEKCQITPGLDLALVADTSEGFAINRADVTKKVQTVSGDSEKLPEDGSAINMKAVVNRGTQTIKITWNPGKLGYKKYDLQRLKDDGETFEDVATSLTKKNYTYNKKDIERAEKPALFKLVCYDNAGNKTEYVTPVAPSLLYVEQGYDKNNLEFCFSKLFASEDLYYRLEVAEKNKEEGVNEKGKRGFNQVAASVFDSRIVYEIGGFKINATVSVDALRDFFEAQGDFSLEEGKGYFCRVKSVYYYHGKPYASAPSNVVSRKAGPAKVYVFDVNGLNYTKPTGNKSKKEKTEDDNIKIMDKYLHDLFFGEYSISGSSIGKEYFIHKSNEGPDAKSGYIVFFAPRVTDDSVKGYELLRSDSQYGTYKKMKLYKMGTNNEPQQFSGLYKWKPTEKEDKEMLEKMDYDIFYMQYNNFPPEKPYYYAVRGVSKKGNAAGGFGDGYGCMTELDKVQNFYALDGTINKINLYWSFDSCVKEYWIYKKESTDDDSKYKLLVKVKGKKSGTLDPNSQKKADQDLLKATSGNLVGDYVKFVDKSGSKYAEDKSVNKVIEGTVYDYFIVPKYDTKSKDKNYNMDKRSEVVQGMATLAGAIVKNFTAKNYSCGKIILRWTKFKDAPDAKYLIIRTTKDPRDGGDYWTGMQSWVTDGDNYLDTTPVVGQKYFYIIFAGSERSETVTDGALKAARSVPLAVAEAKLSGGESFKRGPRINWTINQRDKGAGVEYRIQRRGGGDWVTIKKDLSGSGSWVDNSELKRGVKWEYRVVSFYGDVQGGIREAGSLSKPSKIEVNADRTSLNVGETVTVTVYPKIDGGSAASDIRMDGTSSSGAVSVSKEETEGDHITYTIKANYRGSGSVTFKAYDHDWTSGSSSSDLKKTVSFTVR